MYKKASPALACPEEGLHCRHEILWCWARPDCGGTLWEIHRDNLLQFRCRIGHLYSAENLLAEKTDKVEEALWSAVRSLEENASLCRRMSTRMRKLGDLKSAESFTNKSRTIDDQADIIRRQFLIIENPRPGAGNIANP